MACVTRDGIAVRAKKRGEAHSGGELRQQVAVPPRFLFALVLSELQRARRPLGELEVRVALGGLELDVRQLSVHYSALAACASAAGVKGERECDETHQAGSSRQHSWEGSEMRPCIVHMARAATPLMISVEIGLHERLVLGHVLTRLATLDRIGTRRQALARSVFGSLTELQLLHALLLEGEEAKEDSMGGTQHCTTTNKKRTSRYQHCSPVPSEYTSKDKTL